MEYIKTVNEYTCCMKYDFHHLKLIFYDSQGWKYEGKLPIDLIKADITLFVNTLTFWFNKTSQNMLDVALCSNFLANPFLMTLNGQPTIITNDIVAPQFKKFITNDEYGVKLQSVNEFEKMIKQSNHPVILDKKFWEFVFSSRGLVYLPNSKAVSQFWELKIQLMLQYFDSLEKQECDMEQFDDEPGELIIENVNIKKLLMTFTPNTLIRIYSQFGDFDISLEDFTSLPFLDVNDKLDVYLYKNYIVLTGPTTTGNNHRVATISLNRNQMYKFLVDNSGVNLLY